MTNLKYRRGATCCCLTPLLAPPVPFNIASRKELWSHYGEVALAARLAHVCSTERAGLQGQNETSLLALCVIAWCQCVLGVLFLFPPSHDLPSPTGKRVWVGKEEGGGRVGVYLGMGEGLEHARSQVSQIQEIVSWLLFLKSFYTTSQDFQICECVQNSLTPSPPMVVVVVFQPDSEIISACSAFTL